MSDKSHNYELAYHAVPNLEETKFTEIKQELENLIISRGGVISYSKSPERTRLSYPLQKHSAAFFGYILFSLLSAEEALKEVNNTLLLNKDILRFLIVKMPSDLQKNKDMLKQIKMKERVERRPKEVVKAPVSEEEQKKLDEALEDIIGKL